MTTLKHAYRERSAKGGTKIVKGKTVAGLDNPLVGSAFIDFLDDATDDRYLDNFYAAAYIIGEYGDQIRDDLEDLDKEDLREYVIAVEAQQSQSSKQVQKQALGDLLEDADADETEKIVDVAENVLEADDLDEDSLLDEALDGGDDE